MKKRTLYIICAILLLLSCGLAYKVYSLQMELLSMKLVYSADEDVRAKIDRGWAKIAQTTHSKLLPHRLYPFVPPMIGAESLHIEVPLIPELSILRSESDSESVSTYEYNQLVHKYNRLADIQHNLIKEQENIIERYDKLEKEYNDLSEEKFRLWTKNQDLLDSTYLSRKVLNYVEEQYSIRHKVIDSIGRKRITLYAPHLDSALVLMKHYPR